MSHDLVIRGGTVIDAHGAFVTPGFVDIQTHYDGQVTWTAGCNPPRRTASPPP